MISRIFLLLISYLSNILTLENSPVTCSSDGVACGDSVNSVFNDVATIEQCRLLCYDSQDCQYLTYFDRNGFPFQEVCYTFSSCEKTHPCTNCVSETKGRLQ